MRVFDYSWVRGNPGIFFLFSRSLKGHYNSDMPIVPNLPPTTQDPGNRAEKLVFTFRCIDSIELMHTRLNVTNREWFRYLK